MSSSIVIPATMRRFSLSSSRRSARRGTGGTTTTALATTCQYHPAARLDEVQQKNSETRPGFAYQQSRTFSVCSVGRATSTDSDRRDAADQAFVGVRTVRRHASLKTAEQYTASIQRPESFWQEAAQGLTWRHEESDVLDVSNKPFYRWFPGWTLNVCENAVDRHIKTRGNQAALIYESPVTETRKSYTYWDLFEKVNEVACVLSRQLKIQKGDRVVLYMPMVPEAVFAMLACARLGAIHSVVFGGFSAKELASRIDDATPKVVLTASCGVLGGSPEKGQKLVEYLPLLAEAVDRARHRPEAVVILQRDKISVPEGPQVAELLGLAGGPRGPQVLDEATGRSGNDAAADNTPMAPSDANITTYSTTGSDPSTNTVRNLPNLVRVFDWEALVEGLPNGEKMIPCVEVESSHPLYILYTSGTTGKPKGVVRDSGGYATALHWSMSETYFCASDIGWVVGHSYMVYAPLLYGCTSVLYEGKPVGTPDAGIFWDICERNNVSAMFTAPTALRAIRGEDPELAYFPKGAFPLKKLWVAGERCDPGTVAFYQSRFGEDISVLDNYWMTETGWPIAANDFRAGGWPVKPGSAGRPVCGYHVEMLDEEKGVVVPPPPEASQHHEQSAEEESDVVPGGGTGVLPGRPGIVEEEGDVVPTTTPLSVGLRLPLPPGCMVSLYKDDARFVSTYLRKIKSPDLPAPQHQQHEDYTHFLTGDSGFVDGDGYLHVLSRLDDLINCAGHRLSTGAMEAAIIQLPQIVDCAVVGLADQEKTAVPVGFVVLSAELRQEAGEAILNAVRAQVRAAVREEVGRVASFHIVLVVDALPKTRSGKVLRKCLRRIVNGESDPQVPGTIEDWGAIELAKKAVECQLEAQKTN